MKHLGIVAVLVVVAGAALGQGAGDEDVIRMQAKDGGWEIEHLFRTITEYTGKHILYEPENPAIRGKKVDWTGTIDVPKGDLFRWFRATLSFERIIFVPVGATELDMWMALEINATQIGNRPDYVPVEEIEEWKDADGCYITTTVTLEHLDDTSRARNALSQLSTRPNGKINDIPGARGFVIGDFAPVVYTMVQNLRRLDVAAKETATAEAAKAAKAAKKAAPTLSDRRRELEEAVANSRTQVAAQYFLNELKALDAGERSAR